MTTIACVIPAYNEGRLITDVIAAIPGDVQHIIVVNDASSDDTEDVVGRIDDPRLILINHSQNLGVGAAMVSGYKKALELGADVAVKLDGDDQMDAADIARLVAPIAAGEADYAKGMRFQDRSVLREMPFIRFAGNLGLSFLAKAASGYWNIFDPTNGFTAIECTVLERLNLDRLSRGFFFETDMLINLYLIDAVVADVPTKARYGAEDSHLQPAKALLSFPLRLLAGLCRRILWRHFIFDFSPFSAFLSSGVVLFSFGFLYGSYKWISALATRLPTPIGTVMLAILPLILGFQLLLQAAVLDIQNVPRKPIQQRKREVGGSEEPG